MGQAEVTTGGSRPISCRFNYSVLARVQVGNVVVEAQPRRRRRSERGSSKSRDKSSTRFSFGNWVPYHWSVGENKHSWEIVASPFRSVTGFKILQSVHPCPCRAPSTIPLVLTRLLTQVIVRLTTGAFPSLRLHHHHKTSVLLTINPHHHPGRASFPLRARAVMVTPPQAHIHAHRYPEAFLRIEKLPRFRGWKETNGCTPPNPSSSPPWPGRTMTLRRRT